MLWGHFNLTPSCLVVNSCSAERKPSTVILFGEREGVGGEGGGEGGKKIETLHCLDVFDAISV